MTPDDARRALEVVIRSHSSNILLLDRILGEWRNLDPSEKINLSLTHPLLVDALNQGDASRPAH